MNIKISKFFSWTKDRICGATNKFVENIIVGIYIFLSSTLLITLTGYILYGISKSIFVPVYLMLILIFFSLLGLVFLINTIVSLSRNRIHSKDNHIVEVPDPQIENREWRVLVINEDHNWKVKSTNLYCKIHNLKLPTIVKYPENNHDCRYFGSICSDCNEGIRYHCTATMKDSYLEDIGNKALRSIQTKS